MLHALADHKARDVLQEQKRYAAAIAELNEVGTFLRRLHEQDAVVGDDTDREAVQMCKAANQRRPVQFLEFVRDTMP
jgi:tRNA A-37 threonylcarbamoyl transferase component Bud32